MSKDTYSDVKSDGGMDPRNQCDMNLVRMVENLKNLESSLQDLQQKFNDIEVGDIALDMAHCQHGAFQAERYSNEYEDLASWIHDIYIAPYQKLISELLGQGEDRNE